jgi:hypothetical protein
MSDETRPYIIRQGDYLAQLAQCLGFDAEKVWRLPKNEELRKKRGNPATLCPGDLLHVPAEPEIDKLSLKAKTTNKYEAQAVVEINLKLEVDGEPLANEAYEVEGLGQPVEGTSDGEGMVRFKAPIYARDVTLIFPKKQQRYPVRIGHMDPIEEHSGVCARLRHLGYIGDLHGADMLNWTITFHLALFRFQVDNVLIPTGMPDPATRAKLVELHGC